MARRDKSNYQIQAVCHALNVLEEFKGDNPELGVTELSKRLGLHKNNIFRLLATLEARGYVEQDKVTNNYRLGIKSLELGQNFISQMGLLRQARPIMSELVKKLNETCYLAVIRDKSVVYIDALEASRTVRVVSRIGSHLPIYATACGKVQIAFENDEEMEKRLPKELKVWTPNTLTDMQTLKEHLKIVARNGYAIDNEEYEEGVKCVGAPIRDYTGRIVGAISISGPASRLMDEKVEKEFVPSVLKAGAEISLRLGHEPRSSMAA